MVQTVYLLRHCGSYIGGAELHTHGLTCAVVFKTFNHSVDSCNKFLLWRYRSTIHHTLHTTPQEIVERCQIWWPWCLRNWSLFTNPTIWICIVEVIPYLSIKVRRWPEGCIPAVGLLGDQNKSEHIIMTPVCYQTSTLYSTKNRAFPDRGSF